MYYQYVILPTVISAMMKVIVIVIDPELYKLLRYLTPSTNSFQLILYKVAKSIKQIQSFHMTNGRFIQLPMSLR